MFVKAVGGRGSAGLCDESFVHNDSELERACARILETMHQGALVEEYIQGPEVTVGVIGNGDDLQVLPPLEVEYGQGAKTNSFVHKQDNEILHCPARLPQPVLDRIVQAAAAAFISVEARDFGRIDFIYDVERQQPYALELNTFAGLQILSGAEAHLHQSYIGKMAMAMGWSSQELFRRLLDTSMRRLSGK